MMKADRSISLDSPATVPTLSGDRSGDGDKDGLCLTLGLGVGVRLGDGVGVTEGEGLGEGEGEGLGATDGLGFTEPREAMLIIQFSLPLGMRENVFSLGSEVKEY